MSRKQDPYKGQLGRYSTFYLVLIGAAIGFGNVWRFPYLTGENGGSAFLLLYVICLFALGIPMMVAELVVGRVGKRNPVDSINVLCAKSGVTYWWQSIAWFAMAAGFIVLSFYSVVGGIAVAYIFYSAFGYFGATTESQMSFGVLNTNPGTLMGWHTLFLVIVMMVVKRGVRDGIGRAARMLMPLIVVIGFGLLIHAMDTVAFTDGFDYLFEFRPEQLSFSAILQALSHAFFSLTLSVGAMMALGAYMPDRMSAGRASAAVALTDMFLALMAGLIILPLSLSHSALPQQGFGLMFQTLSTAFGEMAWGQFWGAAFYVLVTFAAWTSAIALAEPIVAWLIERARLPRSIACLVLLIAAWFQGLVVIYSFNVWQSYQFAGLSLFGFFDFITSGLLIPLAGLLLVVFLGRRVKVAELESAAGFRHPEVFRLWYWNLRWLMPCFMYLVFILGLFNLLSSLCQGVSPESSGICVLIHYDIF